MLLVWRAFHISRLAAQAGLKFQAYLAAGFGVWLGIQAIVNIGVNMGVLPTKGLTLPLLSYGRAACSWLWHGWACCCGSITRSCASARSATVRSGAPGARERA